MSNESGFKTTVFSAFSDQRLYFFFRAESWNNLDKDMKQQLCQEVVNRDARALGMVRAPEVTFSRELSDDELGTSGNNHIVLNENYFVDKNYTVVVNGKEFDISLPDANMQALNTLFHENQHTYQEQILDGEIEIDDRVKEIEYRSNNFTLSTIKTDSGNKVGMHYLLNPECTSAGRYAYYFQSTERDAHIYAEKKTAEVREMLTEKYGDEPSFIINRMDEKKNGYQATLEKAKTELGNENIEREINKSLVNHYYNTNYPVDPKVNSLVESEMIKSYEKLTQNEKIQESESKDRNAAEELGAEAENSQVQSSTLQEVAIDNGSVSETAEADNGISEEDTVSLDTDGQDNGEDISDGYDFDSQDNDGGFDADFSDSMDSDADSGVDNGFSEVADSGSGYDSGSDSSLSDSAGEGSGYDSANDTGTDSGMDSDDGMGM